MKKGELEIVVRAIIDIADNRLPYTIAVRLHNAQRAAEDALAAREQIKSALLKPYMREGETIILMNDPRYPEVVGKINELWNEDVTVDLGPSLNLAKLEEQGEQIRVSPASLRVLRLVGLWEEDGMSKPRIVPDEPASAPPEARERGVL